MLEQIIDFTRFVAIHMFMSTYSLAPHMRTSASQAIGGDVTMTYIRCSNILAYPIPPPPLLSMLPLKATSVYGRPISTCAAM